MVTKLPKDIIQAVNIAGMNKAKMSFEKTLVMGFLAGAFIAFSGFLAIMVGGGMPGIKMTNPGIQKFVFGGTFPVGLSHGPETCSFLIRGTSSALFSWLFTGLFTNMRDRARSKRVSRNRNFQGAGFMCSYDFKQKKGKHP